jgi:hypothetical protein
MLSEGQATGRPQHGQRITPWARALAKRHPIDRRPAAPQEMRGRAAHSAGRRRAGQCSGSEGRAEARQEPLPPSPVAPSIAARRRPKRCAAGPRIQLGAAGLVVAPNPQRGDPRQPPLRPAVIMIGAGWLCALCRGFGVGAYTPGSAPESRHRPQPPNPLANHIAVRIQDSARGAQI